MKKVGVLGSCLAGLTAAMLAADYGWPRQNNSAVQRSDLFVKYFVRRGPMPSREAVEQILSILPEYTGVARPLLDNMFRATAGTLDLPSTSKPLLHNLEHGIFDLFLLDNLHDTQQIMYHYHSIAGSMDFDINFPLFWCDKSENKKALFEKLPPLEVNASVGCWREIVIYLRSVQPSARIIFICAPSSTFVSDLNRRDRADAFEPAFRDATRGLDVEIIPRLHIPQELSKLPDDQEHFDMKVYRALAGRVFTSMLAAE